MDDFVLPSPDSFVMRLRTGVKIANVRGVPGTLGGIAYTLHDKQTVLFTNWHILFGNDGPEDGEVFLVNETNGQRQSTAIGNTLYGKIGIVHFDGDDYFVDCAVSSCLNPPQLPALDGNEHEQSIGGLATVQPGDLVTKTGAVTGRTTGIVVDDQYSTSAWISGRPHLAPRQLLVRPTGGGTAFAAGGDSGAVLLNAMGRAVGLLWGVNSRGEGLACPIGPVLYAMNISLERTNP